MRIKLALRFVAAICVFLGMNTGAAAAIHAVDCAHGPFFDIDAAVQAAGAGDTVAVSPCSDGPYAPFTVMEKADVHIVGLPPGPAAAARVTIDGQGGFECIRIVASQRVSLAGLHIRNCGFHALEVEGSTDTSLVGNRIDGGLEAIRDQGSLRTRLIGNTISDALFSIFIDGDRAFVSGNRIVGDQAAAILTLNSGNHVVGNTIRGSATEGIIDQATGSRIERNVITGSGGQAAIVLNTGSSNADVVGNITGNSILDQGTGTELAGNR